MKKGYILFCLLFLTACQMPWQTKTVDSPVISRGRVHINQPDEKGQTPLMKAVQNISSPEIIATMIRKGANPNQQDQKGWTALTWAVVHTQNPKVISMLLKQGANPNITTYSGNYPVDFAKNNAALTGSPEIRYLRSVTLNREEN